MGTGNRKHPEFTPWPTTQEVGVSVTSQAADQHRAGTGQKQLKHLYRFHPTLSKVSTTRTGRVTSLTCRANGDRMYFSLSIDFYAKIRMSLFAGGKGAERSWGRMGSPIPGSWIMFGRMYERMLDQIHVLYIPQWGEECLEEYFEEWCEEWCEECMKECLEEWCEECAEECMHLWRNAQ